MINKLKQIWKNWCDVGVRLPYLYDPTTELPSITLGMLYITSLIMFTSLIALHFQDNLLTSTLTTVMVWLLAYVMYRLRKLDKVKFDLDDKTIELEDTPDENNKQDDESESVK